jgi:hypothetical protein
VFVFIGFSYSSLSAITLSVSMHASRKFIDSPVFADVQSDIQLPSQVFLGLGAGLKARAGTTATAIFLSNCSIINNQALQPIKRIEGVG